MIRHGKCCAWILKCRERTQQKQRERKRLLSPFFPLFAIQTWRRIKEGWFQRSCIFSKSVNQESQGHPLKRGGWTLMIQSGRHNIITFLWHYFNPHIGGFIAKLTGRHMGPNSIWNKDYCLDVFHSIICRNCDMLVRDVENTETISGILSMRY